MNDFRVTLVWRTDLHLSDHTPRSRTDVWSDTVLRKIEAVGEIARRAGADAVLDGGDFFDIKSPSRNSHALVRRVFEAHRNYPCPVYANVGNHDCVYGDYSFLHQQPLGVLFESGLFRRLYDEHELVIEKAGRRVRVVGVPYHGNTYDMTRFEKIGRGTEHALLVCGHLLASPTETTMFAAEDVIRYDRLDAYPADMYLFGHWHRDQGIRKTPGGRTVVNIGSLTRGSLAQDDLDRIPSVAVIRITREGIQIEKVPVPAAPAEEVFDLVARDVSRMKESSMEEFVTTLGAALETARELPLREKIASLSEVPQVVKERALAYIEKVGGK